MDWVTKESVFNSPTGARYFYLLHTVLTGSLTHPASCPMEIRQLGCEADRSPTSNANDKKGGTIPPLPYMSSWHGA
jgi:hypothetical protein